MKRCAGMDVNENLLREEQARARVAGMAPDEFVEHSIGAIARQVGDGRAVCGLSGGVDSSVAAALVHRAVGDRLTCIFVDHGLLRKGEARGVEDVFRGRFRMNLVAVDARDRFLAKLAGVADPEAKRKIIGEQFIRVFEEEASKLGDVGYLVQGTIYPDVLESRSQARGGAGVKSHHNVGGLPEDVRFELVEPLRYLFKDEVRRVGHALGLPESLVNRQPFPGPGLAVRILGEVTRERLEILRQADAVVREEIEKLPQAGGVWQYFAVLPAIRSVGVAVIGDAGEGADTGGAGARRRTYSHLIAVRAVTSSDAMTAQWARLPHGVLDAISRRIVAEVPGVNRVVYDITSKPPSTIEWE